MNVTAETPRVATTIASHEFQVAQPYTAGHQLTEGEASAMNQLLRENVRNNIAGKIKAAQEKSEPVPTQADVDAYVATYEFGVRKAGSSKAPVDPVEKEMYNLARAAVVAAVKAAGKKVKDFEEEALEAKITEVIAENEQALRKQATTIVKNKTFTPSVTV